MKANQIYVNFPVKDVQKTKEFWTKLGFPVNEQFSDDKAVCVMINEDSMYIMFLAEEYFRSFIDRPVAPANTVQVLVSIGLNSREEVDRVVNTALENGAYQHEEPEDFGWMYQNSFWDPDGHGWNITFADLSQMPAQQ
ncbi:VOC family protein [Chryseobacterium arthrosphaerae]|uniref:VOC family protein n=1 Tax=Chryseobacterium arthrosphaerae TaxID=651561 RepID=UPI001F4B39FF|nr:VOC family protein [Chryseobacterium arthrosphaerae]MDG4651427.1 VOC family protein [Chryseobacterium arthrosphaerae]